MSKETEPTEKIFYSPDDHPDAPSERAHIVADFLPPPDQLVFREDTQKVTLALSRPSIEFFKLEVSKPYPAAATWSIGSA